jgi:hypothetical protein
VRPLKGKDTVFTLTLDQLSAKQAEATSFDAPGLRVILALLAIILAILAVRLIVAALEPFKQVIAGAASALGGLALIVVVVVLLLAAVVTSAP